MQLWQTTYIRPKVCLLFSLDCYCEFYPESTFLCKNKCRAKNAKKGKKSPPLTNSLLTPLTSVFVSWEEGLMQKTYFTLQKFPDILSNCSCTPIFIHYKNFTAFASSLWSFYQRNRDFNWLFELLPTKPLFRFLFFAARYARLYLLRK